MNYGRRITIAAVFLCMGALGGCASLPEDLVSQPQVKLSNIEVAGLGFNAQTFLLTLDVTNPNAFPLPVNHFSYALKLDGQRFANGDTPCGITIPAGGQESFTMSVELDLLNTAPRLLSVVRDRSRTEIPYELKGQFGIDVPMAPSVSYRTDGSIRLR